MGARKHTLTPKVCEIPGCGYSKVIQRHRIVPGMDGGRYVKGNVIALCPNHHAEADRGWIEATVLVQIVLERLTAAEESHGDIQGDEQSLPSPDRDS